MNTNSTARLRSHQVRRLDRALMMSNWDVVVFVAGGD